ncbi:hypothetical protein [Lentzea flaviverrucosa]|uniref:Proteins of 100 residues with WXG n=1 Tax=Lentzea flaviverrucosa TaxID=200379 RepID=A0A1H9GAV2_9PSEU|nr:hypothetical protein [Lentzea flaviverrucosa]RDI34964.1 hypothetical protein DFR72_101714 [Lentzea flaviverrucosa]SEQ47143.1 hypothetical protein SAMN05216195_102503 [Lentzea flaviverrucosa]
MTAPETPLPSPPGMHITEENKLKGSLFIEAYGSLIDGISKDAESETEKALDITFNAIGAASATVMFAIDPLGSIIGAGVGWLIEHVSFLRDALNQLMGNPEEIQANVEANKARAAELRVLAEDHKSGLATFDGWTGAASENYKKSMDGMSQELDDLANAVESKAKIVAIMGMLVTVLRDIVRDLIAQLIGSLIGGAIIAAAMMIPTFGTSIAVFGGFAVGKAVALGVNIASRVARVVAALGRQMKRIGDLDDIMKKVSKGWERFENSADVAEITYEGYKAQDGVNKKIDEAMENRGAGGGGNTPPGATDGKTAADATGTASASMVNARVGTVQDGTVQATLASAPLRATEQGEPMQALRRTEAVAAEPMQALRRTATTEPMQALRATQAAEPMQAVKRMDAEPLQPMLRGVAMSEPAQPMLRGVAMSEPAQPMQAVRAMDAAEPLQARTAAVYATEPVQAFQRAEAVQAPMAFQRAEAVEAPMAFQRAEAVQAPTAFSRVEASDSTMVSGVSMTSGTPAYEAVQPMQAREMYISPETPSEPLQASSGYEPLARTQMSHAYDALEPSQQREVYSRVDAEPVYESVNPLMASEPLQATTAYEAAGGAAAEPLRPTIAHERSVRPTE